MSEQQTTIIEINGVKMEVDLRQARIVHENIKVGSKVRLLVKASYGDPAVFSGIVAGFEPFPTLPTIIVAYVKTGYSEAGLEFAYVNAKSAEKFELVPSLDDDLPIDKERVLEVFEREIAKHQAAMDSVMQKRAYFLEHFGVYFGAHATADAL